MNEIQQIIWTAHQNIKKTPKERHNIKWRNKILDRLEELQALAANVPNPNHPYYQPMPEPPPEMVEQLDYDPDEPIDLTKIDLFGGNHEPND